MSFWFTLSMLLLMFIVYKHRSQLRIWLVKVQKQMYTFPHAYANGLHRSRPGINEYLLTENETLQNRVLELEKIVTKQQNEMMLLQATTADVLVRLGRLEASHNGMSNGHTDTPRVQSNQTSPIRARLPPRSQSQSVYSLAGSNSPSRMTRSMYAPPEQSPLTAENGSRRQSQALVNVPVGRSTRGSPMRKWLSHVDVGASPSTSRVPPPPSSSVCSNVSSVSRTPSVFSRRGSTFTLHASRRNVHEHGANPRDPAFQAASGVLVIHVQGRNVVLPVPSDVEEINPMAESPAPSEKLKLDWVYGYRGKDVRNSLDYLPTGELIYFSGCVVILYSPEENIQRHYVEHTSDIKSLAVHPNRHIIATGQTSRHDGERPTPEHNAPIATAKQLEKQLEQEHTEAHVRIWDSINLSTLSIISHFEKGVCSVSFSQVDSGVLLACVDESFQHTLSVWNWNSKEKVADNKGANDQVFGCYFHPTIKGKLVMYGKGHFSFWQLDMEGGFMMKHVVSFEGRDKPKSLLSLCFTDDGQIATGDSNGSISLWDPNTFKMLKQAHAVHPGGVFCLTLSKKGTLWSVGKDRNISEWDAVDLVKRRRSAELPDDAGLARSIVFGEGNQVLIGCSSNTIFAGDMDQGFSDFLQGDNDDVVACVSSLNDSTFLTASKDGVIRMWNSSTHKVEWFKNYGEPIECLSIHPSGEMAVIGFSSGMWCVIDINTRDNIAEQKESTHPVTCIQWAPNGILLLIATKDLSALIYRLDNAKRLHRSCRIGALSSWLISADWETESNIVRVNTAAGHLHHYNCVGEQIEPSAVRDLKWASVNCRLSFEAGCATHATSGVATVAGLEKLLAVGRENGTIRLYNSPAGHQELSGHGYAVTSLCFQKNLLISAGSNDTSLLQWKIEKF